ncbi:MAG TPA: TIM barrel protein [Pirellulaceae bacterium]|nr:TIM barrel protein [Pirellulaceae bacterium]
MSRIVANAADSAMWGCVIDMNTSSLASMDEAYLDRCREAAEKAGCVFTNLKMNQRDVDMSSADEATRRKALEIYKASIDAASRLGCRWARPLPLPERPDMKIHIASYQELADYGAKRNIEMLVENYGWMQGDPNSVVISGRDTALWAARTTMTSHFWGKGRKSSAVSPRPSYPTKRSP